MEVNLKEFIQYVMLETYCDVKLLTGCTDSMYEALLKGDHAEVAPIVTFTFEISVKACFLLNVMVIASVSTVNHETSMIL